jgi:hypothetical protein
MLQPVKDISTALVNIAVKVYGSIYDYDRDVEDKKGVKHKDKDEEDAKKGFWNKTKAFLWNTLDFFFGPSTLKIITFLSIAMLAFSPFGPIAIAISASISVLCLGLGVVVDGKNLKDLRVQQKEAKSVESIMELQMEKLEILDKSPELKKILDDVLQKGEKLNGKDQTVRIKNVLQHFPEALIPLIGNIMTGNMISISAGAFCVMVGGISAVNEQQSFSKQREEMHEIVQAYKILLKGAGIDIDYPRGGGLEFLKGLIVNTENEINAIKNIQEKIEKGELTLEDPAKIKLQFASELESVKDIPRTEPSKADGLEVKGLNYYVKKAFTGSFFYDQSREIFAPLAHYNADNHKKLEEFYKDRQLQETIALEKDKDIGVEVSVKGKQFASKLATGREESNVQRLKGVSVDSVSRSP